MPDTIEWSGYKWLTQERWGNWHPHKPWNWYDPKAVKVENNQLILDIINNPKDFSTGEFDENGDRVYYTSKYGMGLVTCETDFRFGIFEIEAQLPKGIGLWPAFWAYPTTTWPPEIDIECYSGKNGSYRNWNPLKPYRVESCFHSEKGLGLKPTPVIRPWFFQLWKNPSKNFNKYKFIWTPDIIAFYINDHLIRKITDESILYQASGYKMMVILNNHIDGNFINEFSLSNYKDPFRLNYFKYTSI